MLLATITLHQSISHEWQNRIKIFQTWLELQYTVWRKILTGEILTNGHVENFDENFFDEFHNVNAHIY